MKKKSPRARKTFKTRKRKKLNFKQFWQKLVQKLGSLALFFVIFIILSVIVLFKWLDTSENYMNQLELPWMNGRSSQIQFLEEIAPIAQRLQRETGIFASVSMAQAALESDFGRSQLGAEYHNLYGVKASESDADKVLLPTMEYLDDEWHEINDWFKVYPDWEASMENHANLIQNGTTWDPTFYHEVLEGDSPSEQTLGLQNAGYATDPTYHEKLNEIIKLWELEQYDQPMGEAL